MVTASTTWTGVRQGVERDQTSGARVSFGTQILKSLPLACPRPLSSPLNQSVSVPSSFHRAPLPTRRLRTYLFLVHF